MSEQQFHTPLPLTLEVAIPAGEIEVETVDGEESVIVVEGDEKLVEQTEVRHEGNRLVVAFRGRKTLGVTISIGDFSFGRRHLTVRAKVPHGISASFDSAAADVTVDGRLAELSLKSASGDLHAHGEIEHGVTLKTVSGDARLDRVGGEVKIQTVSGDVTLGLVGSSLEAKTISGDLRVNSLRRGNANFTSVSGDVELGIAAGTFLDVDAGSVSGDLHSDVALQSDPGEGGGDGPTVVLRGKTISGDVKVFRALA